jgi:hypothetical protein
LQSLHNRDPFGVTFNSPKSVEAMLALRAFWQYLDAVYTEQSLKELFSDLVGPLLLSRVPAEHHPLTRLNDVESRYRIYERTWM